MSLHFVWAKIWSATSEMLERKSMFNDHIFKQALASREPKVLSFHFSKMKISLVTDKICEWKKCL